VIFSSVPRVGLENDDTVFVYEIVGIGVR